MILDYETLKFIWWVLVGVLLIGFAITDGMDMGVGNLLPFLGKTDDERRVIINTVGPHWDGNQVWLITAGGAIFAAWPGVYATVFSGFYLAMLLVLFALFFRPVGFDYRSKLDSMKARNMMDWGLFVGGFVPTLIFGVAFGNLLQGVPFHLDEFLKAHYDGWFIFALLPLLNPFALLAGLLSVAMFTVHGALWLQLRTELTIAERAKKVIAYGAPAMTILFALGGIWLYLGIDGYRIVSQPPLDALPNPLNKEVVREGGAWLTNYSTYPIMMLAPAIGLLAPLLVRYYSQYGMPGRAFFANSLAMAGIICTAGFSMFPFIMPSSSIPGSSFTIWDASSSHLTLTVMFWAVVIFLPIVLSYTIWTYYKMWGRISVEDIKENKHSVY